MYYLVKISLQFFLLIALSKKWNSNFVNEKVGVDLSNNTYGLNKILIKLYDRLLVQNGLSQKRNRYFKVWNNL